MPAVYNFDHHDEHILHTLELAVVDVDADVDVDNHNRIGMDEGFEYDDVDALDKMTLAILPEEALLLHETQEVADDG